MCRAADALLSTRRLHGLDAAHRVLLLGLGPRLRQVDNHDVSELVLRVVGDADGINPELERAGRVADFIEFGELMCRDALMREESCGGHFRVEHQTEDGEALRDDENFAFAGVWEYKGDDIEPQLHKESLIYENVELATRSYK